MTTTARKNATIFAIAMTMLPGIHPLTAVAAIANGLAPQFAKWPVPMYTSHVTKTMTYAPTSYAVDTSDSVATVIAWYQSKLKGRATLLHGHVTQIAVDGGSYIINLLKTRTGADINVIKN